jgi:hypothetical protein
LGRALWDLVRGWRKAWPRPFTQAGSQERASRNGTHPEIPEDPQGRIRDALRALERRKIPFRGPFELTRGTKIYFIEEYILTEAEILALYENGLFYGESKGCSPTEMKQHSSNTHTRSGSPEKEMPKNRRQSQRVAFQVPVLVRAEMPDGASALSQAFTVEINAHGGLMELSVKLSPNQEIMLINPHTRRQAGCRVLRVEGSSESCFRVSFEFHECDPLFWPLSFVPKDWGKPEGVERNSS